MSNIERKLVSVRRVTEVLPIPNADSIELSIVDGGWPVVTKINDFYKGDLAIYAESDSFIPHELAPFLSKGNSPREYNGVKGERLRTIKLRNTISQGLLLKLEDITEKYGLSDLVEGQDLTEALGVQKWEAPIPACLVGKVRGNFPSYISKTDQQRAQNIVSSIFNDHKDELYEITIKLDGSSCTIYVKDGVIGVCSRNLDLEETDSNSYWEAARSQGVIDSLGKFYEETGRNIALQMELIGEGIQKNQERISGRELYLFDIYDIDAQRYLTPEVRHATLDMLVDMGANLAHVPILHLNFQLTEHIKNLEGLLEFANGSSLNANVKREGVVFKSMDSSFSFKAISNQWLLKNE